jgi:hypothetical protein
MKRLLALLIVFALVGPADAKSSFGPKSDQQLKTARKFVEAVRGKHDYSDAMLAAPLNDKQKTDLARFAKCSVVTVNPVLREDPRHANSFSLDPDQVAIVGKCRGVPDATPPALTLHFQGTKISSVETSNFDLIPASQ